MKLLQLAFFFTVYYFLYYAVLVLVVWDGSVFQCRSGFLLTQIRISQKNICEFEKLCPS